MSEALDFGLGDSQYVFTDLELNELLGVIERKAAGEAEPDALDFLRANDGNGLALQFQPRSHKDNGSGCSLEQSAAAAAVKVEEPPVSALSSALASPVDTPALTGVADPTSLYGSGAEISILPMPHAAASAATSLHAYSLPGTAGHAALVGSSPALVSTLVAAATAAQQAQHNAQLAAAAAGCLPVHASHPLQLARFASVPAPPGRAMSMPMAEPKGQISHSTVEKQRRDRINSLIDELRELVPPQQRSAANGAGAAAAANDAGGLEARRPKHVVLADTIQLLKHLQLKLSMGTLEVGGVTNGCYGNGNGGYCNGGGSGGVGGRPGSGFNGDEDTANSEGKASKGSSSHDDMEVGGAPQMPHIPCQMTQMSGVTVERGPDCYYVQVKCRDRKGLLSDIINALRQLPLEIRTAAVTTTNGTVRDVFEVKLDDPGLSPEDVQNLVHDALFQSHLLAAQSDSLAAAGKRPRA